MLHAMGINGTDAMPLYRNYYAAEPDDANLIALVDMGLMRRSREIPGGLAYYHVTDEGKAVLAVDILTAERNYWKRKHAALEAFIREEVIA